MSSVGTLRIAGVNLQPNKHIWIALTSIYGIGKTTSLNICKACKISPETRVSDLAATVLEDLRKEISNYTVEGDLRRSLAYKIKRIIELKCYRGLRHIRKLPCRGQRTKTNARTRKGRKRIPKEAAK